MAVHRPLTPPADMEGNRPKLGRHIGPRASTRRIDSEYDYDPFWKRCVELKVSPASHSHRDGLGDRGNRQVLMSTTISVRRRGDGGDLQGAFMGGVTHRFRSHLRLLEGGVGWAVTLLNDLIEPGKKRNSKHDPIVDRPDLVPRRCRPDSTWRIEFEFGQALGRPARSPVGRRPHTTSADRRGSICSGQLLTTVCSACDPADAGRAVLREQAHRGRCRARSMDSPGPATRDPNGRRDSRARRTGSEVGGAGYG